MHVLFADDEPQKVKSVAARLRGLGHTSDCVETLDEALEILVSKKVDVVVIDIYLPVSRLTLSAVTLEEWEKVIKDRVTKGAAGPGFTLYQIVQEKYPHVRSVIYSVDSPLAIRNLRRDITITCPIIQKTSTGISEKLDGILHAILGRD